MSPFRLLRIGAGTIATAALLACGKDSNTEPDNTDLFSVTVDSGSNSQIAVVGHTVHVAVTVTSTTGASVSGLTALWTVSQGAGTVSAASSLTDANGHTSIDWTLSTAAGPNALLVNVNSGIATVTATGSPDVLANLIKVSPDTQTVVATGLIPVVARAVDQFGNGVQGVTVGWTASGGTITPATSVTGASGNAQATFASPAAPGTFAITATVSGLNPVTLTVRSQ